MLLSKDFVDPSVATPPILYSHLEAETTYREGVLLPNPHFGQRKLLIGELYHIASVIGDIEEPIVVYAGSAHGWHLGFIHLLFPQIKFVLYDRNPHCILTGVDQEQNYLSHPDTYQTLKVDDDYAQVLSSVTKPFILAEAEFFTTKEAIRYESLADRVILFSDVRRAVSKPTNTEVFLDQYKQEQWRVLMGKPTAFLKHRALYPGLETKVPKDITNYKQGFTPIPSDTELFLQPWAPSTSTETRLVVPRNADSWLIDTGRRKSGLPIFDIDPNAVAVNVSNYEKRMFAHNISRSITAWEEELDHRIYDLGLSNGWDSLREVRVLEQVYATRREGDWGHDMDIDTFIVSCITKIIACCVPDEARGKYGSDLFRPLYKEDYHSLKRFAQLVQKQSKSSA